MFLRPFGTEDDWDREAALQMLLVIRSLYVQDANMLATVSGIENTIVVQHFYGTYTWPPAWVVFRSNDDVFTFCWAGTTNSVQFTGHMIGSGIAPVGVVKDLNYKLGTAQPNLPWSLVAEEHLKQFVAAVGTVPPGARFRCSGHSYGGAVAQLVASELRKSYPGEVQCIVFGSPKTWTEQFGGPFPQVYWRIESEGDIVTITPPNKPDLMPIFANLVDTVSAKGPEAKWDWIPLRWAHYGKAAVLYADGGLVAPDQDPVPLPKYVTTSPIAKHYTNNYFGRILANAGGS